MEFNPSQVIHIYNKVQKPNSYTVYSSQLHTGICIFSKISWCRHLFRPFSQTHRNRISKKANNTLGFLRRNIKIHSESLKSSVYKVLVRPQLEYCSTVWCPFTDSNISKLEVVQRRTARWVKHDYGQTSSVTEMMQSLHWRTLDQRRIDNKLSLSYVTGW